MITIIPTKSPHQTAAPLGSRAVRESLLASLATDWEFASVTDEFDRWN
jgi:hypothetical protein